MNADRPLILCEGQTDPVYLRAAIQALANKHPTLATINNGKLSLRVRFFKYSTQARDILQLRGGVSDIKFFLIGWNKTLASIKYQPSPHPVIILIDNDNGAKEIFSVLSSMFNVTATIKTDVPFYHLGGRLYLVKTPTIGTEGLSCIENFLPDSVLKTVVNGKHFNLTKKHQAPNEYGKAVLAEQVVRPNAATIDFSAFEPLLARLDAVVLAHCLAAANATNLPQT